MHFLKMNALGKERKAFLFISDFDASSIEVFSLDELKECDIEFSIDENYKFKKHAHTLDIQAIDFSEYKQKFDLVIEKIKSGETYVLNLTQATPIKTPLTLKDIFRNANAPYKLRFKDQFVCFSPETFVSIQGNTISTFPMKGTIDANINEAEKKILSDKKELAEHIMIVDLLRNDLSIVAQDVQVEKFRYITKIDAGLKQLLQVSSHISGNLGENWHQKIGTILQALLPAGSISGAPKKSTLKIIKSIENYERGYFSGVFGYFDGENLHSCVMIRYIEKTPQGLVYKSGGGITLDSDARMEYDELQNKIYLP